MGRQLRHYQVEAEKAVFESLSKGVSKQMLVLATGLGKTYLASSIAHKFKRILFMCHTEELIDQGGIAILEQFYPSSNIKNRIEQSGGVITYFKEQQKANLFADKPNDNFGLIKAECFDIDHNVVLASYQTIHRRLDRIPANHFDLIIIDESHLAGAASIVRTLSYLTPKLLLGLTATPYRVDGVMLGDIFEQISYQYNIGDGVKDGYLVELDAIQIKTNIDLDKVRTTAGEFNNRDLKEVVDTDERNQLIVDKYKQYADGKQNLVFCVDVEHVKNVTQKFIDNGYKAEYVVGDTELTPDRRAVIDRFKNKEIQVLVNCMILTAGFDYPEIGCISLACPTKSLTKYMQQLGRGTRTLPGVIDGLETADERRLAISQSDKPKCTILDIVDVTSRHRLINTFELDRKKPIAEKVFMTQKTKDLLLFEKEKKRIAFESNRKVDKKINLLELPIVKLSKYSSWTNDATEKQLILLEALGYNTKEINYTNGMAHELISNSDATPNQIAFLKWKNFDVSKGVTRGEAALAFALIKKNEENEKRQKQTSNNLIDGIS